MINAEEAFGNARMDLDKAVQDAAYKTAWAIARNFGVHVGSEQSEYLRREELAQAIASFIRS